MKAQAIVFDFNGTLSDDEPILYRIFAELFAEHGRPLTQQEYLDQLAGLSDPEIVGTWLGHDNPVVDDVVEQRIERYRAAVSDGSSITPDVREAVRYAADRVPVAIVSGAARPEIEPVVAAAGLADVLHTIVPAEDVEHGKPHPAGYERALLLLNGGLAAEDVVAFEDTEAGIASAKAAGLHVLAVRGTLPEHRLAQADEIVAGIDVAIMQRLLD
jgi:beta-phosphoglucomutase